VAGVGSTGAPAWAAVCAWSEAVDSEEPDEEAPPHPPTSTAAMAKPTPRPARPMDPMVVPASGRRTRNAAVTSEQVGVSFKWRAP
jgi:hypothetical protein